MMVFMLDVSGCQVCCLPGWPIALFCCRDLPSGCCGWWCCATAIGLWPDAALFRAASPAAPVAPGRYSYPGCVVAKPQCGSAAVWFLVAHPRRRCYIRCSAKLLYPLFITLRCCAVGCYIQLISGAARLARPTALVPLCNQAAARTVVVPLPGVSCSSCVSVVVAPLPCCHAVPLLIHSCCVAADCCVAIVRWLRLFALLCCGVCQVVPASPGRLNCYLVNLGCAEQLL
jgi:hypothetical protein